MIHCIVENAQAQEFARQELEGEQIKWHTTSPWLLMNAPAGGEDVQSLEEGVDYGVTDALGKAAILCSETVCARLDDICDWREYVCFEDVLAPSLGRCLFTTAYKAMLLERCRDGAKAEGGRFVCVGSPDNLKKADLGMNYGRFDTLYSAIAERMGEDVLRHAVDPESLSQMAREVTHRRMGSGEKFLSLLNNTFSSALYKTWRTLNGKRLWPFRTASINPFARHTFFVVKDCELIEENFLSLLCKGGRLARLPELPQLPEAPENAQITNPQQLQAELRNGMIDALESLGILSNKGLKACVDIVTQRALAALTTMHVGLPAITEGFDAIAEQMGSKASLFTNALFAPVQRMFYCYCRDRRIAVAACEHGITLGLSKWSEWGARQFAMKHGDVGVYHSEEGMRTMAPYSAGQKQVLGGASAVTRNVCFSGLQRRFARRMLGVGQDEHIVMYMAEIERNNYIYGPHSENDLQFLHKTRQIVEQALAAYPQSKVVLKLYPGKRYVDTYCFEDLEAKFPNLIIVKEIDFRFLRAAADLLLVSSSQSTLGWVLGAGKPTLFYDFEWSPSLLSGISMRTSNVEGVKAVKMLSPSALLPRGKRLAPADLLPDASK